MRILIATAILATACSSKTSTANDASPSSRFLPPAADLVVRLDMQRIRAWPQFGKVAPIALKSVQNLLDAAKQQCNLDVIGDASRIVIARRGALLGGDVTAIASGLAADKVKSCLTTIASSGSIMKVAFEGELVQVSVSDRPLASGAFLPGGDIVFVSRSGAGVEPAAWKTEVAGSGTAPAWWANLDATAPISARVATSDRVILASAQLGDPLVVRGTSTATTEALAKEDVTYLKAIFNYFEQGKAGTGRVTPKGTTTEADLTARGDEIDNLITIALPALVGESLPDLTATVSTEPRTCDDLNAAVTAYMGEGLNRTPEARKAEMTAMMGTVVPALQKAFVDACKADAWPSPVIDCHVRNATELPKFEKCAEQLDKEPRDRLNVALSSALQSAKPTK